MLKLISGSLLTVMLFMTTSTDLFSQKPIQQTPIRLVQYMPERPFPYKMKDWSRIAKKQDSLFFDFNAKGRFLPLIWWDDSKTNFPIRSFGLPSYVGSLRNLDKNGKYESLPVIGAVLGASLAGIDKSNQNGNDYVTMCKQFFNKANGEGKVLNTTSRKIGNSFWYEIFPGMAFHMLVDQYPANTEISGLMKLNAESWLPVIQGLSKNRQYPDFNYTSYNTKTGEGLYNGRWREPDAAAGLAWLQFSAYKRFGEQRFLEAAKSCMDFLQNRPAKEGVFYEIMMPYGAYMAVRMNAEMGTSYDEMKMINWCFDGDNSDRDGWGVMAERWGNYDVHGLVGQKKWEQYAFAMNTYSHAAALMPIVKYNPAYAHSIGKWILNLANASRLFYADEHPRNRQSSAVWEGDPDHVICYEGVRKDLDHENFFKVFKGVLADEGPYAIGDQVKNNTSFTDICPYGSAWSGMLAAIVDTTNVEMILRLDCNATDFFGDRSFPTYLYYNPFPEQKEIEYEAGDKPVQLYDLVNRAFIPGTQQGKVKLAIPGNDVRLIVQVPAGAKPVVKGNKLMLQDKVISYKAK
jgi:hypothetical protein